MVMKNTMTAGTARGHCLEDTKAPAVPPPPLLLYRQSKCLSVIMESFDLRDPQEGLKHPQRSADYSLKTTLDHKGHMC